MWFVGPKAIRRGEAFWKRLGVNCFPPELGCAGIILVRALLLLMAAMVIEAAFS
jgi:hypothetical protein